MKYLRQFFDDWLTRAAGIVFLLIVGLVIFNTSSGLPEKYPLFGVFNYSMVPILFIVGGVIFVLAILRSYGAQVAMEHRKRQRRKLLFLMFSGAIGMILLLVGGYQLMEFTDSTAFCGRLCHQVMYPEYTTYQASPHSRVPCSDCHVGPGADYMVKSKVSGIPLIFHTLFGSYERPVTSPVLNLRPARETCEQCHWPEKFTEDRIRVYDHYLHDEQNTKQTHILAFRVGGGEPGTASGIHWHIASSVWYLPLDSSRQEIGWVGVETENGEMKEYFDLDKLDEINTERIEEEKRFMDCIDCHDRATHIFYSPDELIDAALSLGEIDASLPYIKRLGVEALDVDSPGLEVTMTRVESIADFYQSNYPEVYQERHEAIAQAIEKLKELADLVIFPDMDVSYQTHSDFLGPPGCFRCHGRLATLPQDGEESEVIDADCSSCHYSVSIGEQPYTMATDIPHSTEGRADCRLCHQSLTTMPVDPAGHTSEICTTCHQPSSLQSGQQQESSGGSQLTGR
ncbi:MAG: NapC/NirT family cytochrome c [Dehalococcoidia bacterium]